MKRILLAAALGLAFAGTASAAALTYKIDPNHTDVVASWSHFGFSNPIAHFGKVDGTITYDPAKPAASKVEVTIPLDGLDSHVGDFDEHLKSADFFDAAKFPTITFKSTKVEAAGDKKLKVTGDLTVHGVTKPAVLEVNINKIGEQPMAKRAAAGFDASTTLKRSEFGIGKYAPNVSDEVKIRITTEAIVPKP
ncbi:MULTISPECIES: YceI family protein [unclassified Lysobacter]|uniref:YceI family protein n=1 Tax=unclassified Lysobacter TaxID=2635362 RepID=UPI001BE60470|nr:MULTISPECIES: YceI family protein [unclassified Lysobacter]MBT2746329.1 polyisoprenoid-binding protein [Lysobacter sp. ISL-42]MBT2751198.1 polyisoprenoid-binding protein [Lysobacter sp. ISL-50]MBT2775606.1 polyisoprenoid-binding protein [Lysobacter sp. ISL-54]MBT2779991.1 polyisoprenoid-binding protein [Lysobacter sp. ISL-52]